MKNLLILMVTLLACATTYGAASIFNDDPVDLPIQSSADTPATVAAALKQYDIAATAARKAYYMQLANLDKKLISDLTAVKVQAERDKNLSDVNAAQTAVQKARGRIRSLETGIEFETTISGPAIDRSSDAEDAHRVVYVCDAPKSMQGVQFTLLKRELVKAILSFPEIQQYDVVFFQQKNYASFSGRLEAASPGNKEKSYNFIGNIHLQSGTDPLPGIRFALSLKPQSIYLLTDGAFAQSKDVIAEINKLNKDKKIRINTIAFFDDSDGMNAEKQELCQDVLSKIAAENKGIFKTVYVSQLIAD